MRAFYVPPSVIDQWAQLSESRSQAEQLDFILYGGGPLPTVVGERLSKVTDVCQMYGSVETGQIQLLVPRKDDNDWSYMEWNPYEEIDMQPNIEGTYELVLHQKPKFRPHRSLSHNFPDLREWRSGDLFVQHPTKTGLWRYHGRIDDLIVLANSHKVHPIAFEAIIQKHPLVSSVLMFGTGRVQPGLLIELAPKTTPNEILHDQIWDLVQRANHLVPHYGRVTISNLIYASHDKPLPRAPKGSIVRKSALSLYEQEVKDVYARIAKLPDLDIQSPQSISLWIYAAFSHMLPGVDLGDNDDIFSFGMDSLRVTDFTKLLRSALKHIPRDDERISPHLLYLNPSVAQLTPAIKSFALSSPVESMSGQSTTALDRLVHLYSNFEVPRTKRCLILTGSSGFIGSHVLHHLCQAQVADHIFVFTRPDTVTVPQHSIINSCSIERVAVDWTKEHFGLTTDLYESFLTKVHAIIHLSWNVDFNLSLQTFGKDHFKTLRSMINFSIASPRKARVIFASSTAYAIGWALKTGSELVPEQTLPNDNDVACTGYGLSKQVGEKLLETASKSHGVPVTILRMGQIVNSVREGLTVRGPEDWIHALIVTSKNLGLVPSARLTIDWMPVDAVARILSDAGTTEQLEQLRVLNVVHPRPVQWDVFLRALRKGLPHASETSISSWVDAMERNHDRDQETLHKFPALKLSDFFRNLATLNEQNAKLPRFIIDNTLESDEALRDAQLLGLEELVMDTLINGC